MDSEPISDRIEGFVHEEIQASDGGVDLTLAAVSEIEVPGQVDFGGGELEAATLVPIEPQRRHPDDYGW